MLSIIFNFFFIFIVFLQNSYLYVVIVLFRSFRFLNISSRVSFIFFVFSSVSSFMSYIALDSYIFLLKACFLSITYILLKLCSSSFRFDEKNIFGFRCSIIGLWSVFILWYPFFLFPRGSSSMFCIVQLYVCSISLLIMKVSIVVLSSFSLCALLVIFECSISLQSSCFNPYLRMFFSFVGFFFGFSWMLVSIPMISGR